MKANKIRKLYLDFFKSKEHVIVSSAPMIVKDDPTLMFTNAGMNQFKHILLGDITPVNIRVTNSQKCLRVSGKHNDLEEVGHDTFHHTMFEMLGSWSFGDYFKEDAINWAWQFLTDVCHLDKDKLYVTVFEGSDKDTLKKDYEAFNFWKKHLPEDRIINGNKKDNFWEMGEIGPCGPCSEIHFDNRTDSERLKIKGSDLVNKNHPQVIEIWNLVFMQYNRFADGTLVLLDKNHVDTGMGLERLAMIMQGMKSNYDTDIFQPIINKIETISALKYGDDKEQDIAMRVIADHVRAIVFSIADGQLPSNIKAGYVIRRILRRAVRYGYTFLNLKGAFIYKLTDVLVQQMGEQFEEIRIQKKIIEKVIKEEENSFLRTLSDGLKRIEYITQKNNRNVSGKQVFDLYDTYGFPADLTSLILSEKNITYNKSEFDAAMQAQKDRSKNAGKIIQGDWIELVEDEVEEFVGYDNLDIDIIITRYREMQLKDKRHYQLVFNITPFYPEGGGQVGDTGVIENKYDSIKIIDTKKENNLIVHFTDSLPKELNESFIAKVDANNRKASSRNHTATHLLHESLISYLGNHITQKGSLVNADYLRFDFSHFSKIDLLDLKKIELDVNSKILANISLEEHINLPLSKAKKMGAITLFGEKYEDVVRMIQYNTSKELCGGTHVKATGEIGLFKIISESSSSSGIRRIEAITGHKVLDFIDKKEVLLNNLASLIKNKNLKVGVEQLVHTNKNLEKKLANFKKENTKNIKQQLLNSVIENNGVNLILKQVNMEIDEMKNISFQLRKEENLAMVLASRIGEKAILSVMLTDDLIVKGNNAQQIISEIAKEINGGGGGQPFFATAGGSSPDGIKNALDRVKNIIV